MREKVKRIWKIILEEFALLSIELIIVLAVGFVSLIAFFTLADELRENDLKPFDDWATAVVKATTSDFMTLLMKGVTFLSNREFIIFPAILIFIYFLFIKRHRWYSIKIPVVTLGSISLNLLLKYYFERPRPELEHMVHVTGNSFPSGHAMFSFSFYGLLIYILWEYAPTKFWKYFSLVVLLILIHLIGISRVYLGVHYPSDVLAGFAAGFMWLLVSILTIRQIEKFLKKRVKEAALEKAEGSSEPSSG